MKKIGQGIKQRYALDTYHRLQWRNDCNRIQAVSLDKVTDRRDGIACCLPSCVVMRAEVCIRVAIIYILHRTNQKVLESRTPMDFGHAESDGCTTGRVNVQLNGCNVAILAL